MYLTLGADMFLMHGLVKWLHHRQCCVLALVGDKVHHFVLTMIIPHFTLPAATRLADWLSMHHSLG